MKFNIHIHHILEQHTESPYFQVGEPPQDHVLKWVKLCDVSGWNIPLSKSLPRSEINSEVIKENIYTLKNGGKLNPINVSANKNSNVYFIDDGSHRIEALRRLNVSPESIIPVYVYYIPM